MAKPKTVATMKAPTKAATSDWVEPFPASKLADDGKTETVFVRVTINQEITLNGVKHPPGQAILPCCAAHQFAHVLSAPTPDDSAPTS